jgi:hypothetical protein
MAAASRRLFSAESFSLLVEPAIADLQIENSGRFAERIDAYRTVWVGMAAACDDGVARRARAFVRDNELVTLTGWCCCMRRTRCGWWCCCSGSTGASI